MLIKQGLECRYAETKVDPIPVRHHFQQMGVVSPHLTQVPLYQFGPKARGSTLEKIAERKAKQSKE